MVVKEARVWFPSLVKARSNSLSHIVAPERVFDEEVLPPVPAVETRQAASGGQHLMAGQDGPSADGNDISAEWKVRVELEEVHQEVAQPVLAMLVVVGLGRELMSSDDPIL